jgi:hypothetical protein
MSEDSLAASFLISRLVRKLAPSNASALPIATDILRKYHFPSTPYDPSVFLFRWISILQAQGKFNQIGLMQRDVNHLTHHLHIPSAIFRVFDELKKHSCFSSLVPDCVVPKLLPASQSSIPRDFLCVLHGFEGNGFKWRSGQKRFVCRGSMSPDIMRLAQQVSMIGCVVRLLRAFVESREGIGHQYVGEFVSEVLRKHSMVVAAFESGFDRASVHQMSGFLLSAHFAQLRAIAIVCQTIGSAKGGVLYNKLDLISQHGDPDIASAATQMKYRCFEFISQLIRDWVSKGDVDDPFLEFFVRGNPSVILCSKWWPERYSIVAEEVPAVLTGEESSMIFSAGKALNFLRQWDRPVILEIDRGLGLSDFIGRASNEARSRLLGLLNRDNMLMKSLKDIHDFVLLQRGDFALAVMGFERDSIPRRLEQIIRQFSNHSIQEIDCEVSNTDWQFAYRALPPISAVLGQSELTAYKLVSGLLVRFKKTEFNLIRVRSQTKGRTALLLIWEMHSVVRLLQDFLNIYVIKRSYRKVMTICQNSETFDDILQAHGSHVVAITRGCWLTESGRDCRKCLYQLLQGIDNSVFTDEYIQEARTLFHGHVKQFYDVILHHQGTGRALGSQLSRGFGYLLKESA